MKDMKCILMALVLIGMSSTIFAHEYKCDQVAGEYYPSEKIKINVTVDETKLYVEYVDGGYEFNGEIDNTYKPTATNRDFVRFTGETTSPAGGEVWFLIQNGLLSGKDNGYVKEQVRAEGGFFNSKFFCRIVD